MVIVTVHKNIISDHGTASGGSRRGVLLNLRSGRAVLRHLTDTRLGGRLTDTRLGGRGRGASWGRYGRAAEGARGMKCGRACWRSTAGVVVVQLDSFVA